MNEDRAPQIAASIRGGGFAIGLGRRAPPLRGDGGGTRRKAELGDLAWMGLGAVHLGVSTVGQ
jgi:hypothetical protein